MSQTDCLLCQQHQAVGFPRMHHYHWTPAMDAALIAASRSGFGGVKALWRTDPGMHSMPYSVVKYRGQQLGVARRGHALAWTAAEEQVFADHVGHQYALRTWQRLLKSRGFVRSVGAIKARMTLRGWASRQGEWSLLDVATGLGVDHDVVARWVDKGWLRATTLAGTQKPRRYVTTRALRQMLTLYPMLAASGKADVAWIISLFTASGAGRTDEKASGDDESGDWMNGDPTNTTALVLTRRKVMV